MIYSAETELENPAPELQSASPGTKLGPPSRLIAVFLCGAFAFLDLYCTQPLLPLLEQVFHAAKASVGLTISASTLGVAISAALLAMFGERIDRKRMITGAMSALAVSVALTATASTLEALDYWRLVQGLLTPGIFIVTIAYVTEEWSAVHVPRVMSIYVAGTVFGGFIGRLTGGFLAEQHGWRTMFLVFGIAGAIGVFLTRPLLPEPTPKAARPKGESRLAPMLMNLRNPRLLATFGIGFCMLFTMVSVFNYITFYLAAAPFLLSTSALSWLFSVYLAGLVVTLAAGSVLSQIGLRQGMLAAIGLSLSGVAFTLIPSLAAVSIGLSLISSGVFISQTCANSFLRDAAPEGSRVAAAGLYICSYYIGGTAGGLLPGLAWKIAGWPGCALLTACFLAIAALLAFFGWRAQSLVPEPIPL